MVKAWTVVEEKVFSDGSRTTTASPKANLALAESAYYSILSEAAADGSPYHAGVIASKYYDRSDANG